MRIAITTTLLAATTILSSCGGSADSQADADMAAAGTASDVALTGQFELSSEAPFNITSEDIQFTCQQATVASPFRAMWVDVAAGMHLTVTGWPDEDGGRDYRVDAFRIQHQPPGDRATQGRLTGATLAVEELSRTGAAGTYAVEATGTFEQGGTFTASGNCRA
jgi:hypothetical protein